MQKTNRELAKFYGIEEGDIVETYDDNGSLYGVFECKDLDAMCPLRVITCIDICLNSMGIGHIRNRRYEVSKPKIKLGEKKCCEFRNCRDCPLCVLDCTSIDSFERGGWPLYRVLNDICYEVGMKSDNPIYLAFRAELDKEVE